MPDPQPNLLSSIYHRYKFICHRGLFYSSHVPSSLHQAFFISVFTLVFSGPFRSLFSPLIFIFHPPEIPRDILKVVLIYFLA